MDEFKTLAKLSRSIQYIQHMLAITSGFLLMVGLVYSMTNLLTDGLLNHIPGSQVAWSLSQAIAVDANLLLTWSRAAQAYRAKQWREFGFLVGIGAVLMIVAGVVTYLESLQTQGLSLQQAAASIGLSLQVLVLIRSGLVAALAGIIGWSYFALPLRQDSQTSKPLLKIVEAQPPEPPESSVEVPQMSIETRLLSAYTALAGGRRKVTPALLACQANVEHAVAESFLREMTVTSAPKSNGRLTEISTGDSTV